MRLAFDTRDDPSGRRRALIGLLAVICCTRSPLAPADACDGADTAAADWLQAQCLADGVYVLPGSAAAPDAGNLGRVGNLGFLVGSRAVIVIDTGSSRARAEELITAIRRVTGKPIKMALISHPAQEFLFGNAAFVDRGIPVRADPQTPRLMAQRCEHCLQTLVGELGAQRMAGTRLILPAPWAYPRTAVLLEGRRVSVRAGPAGTVPGNLLVHDRASGVIFAGALLSVGRVPAVQDTHPMAWRDALAVLDDPSIRAAVPAYGPVAWRQPRPGQVALGAALDALRAYLGDLEGRARALYADAVPLADLEAQGALPAYREWNGYQPNHLHNIFYRYLQLEAEDLASQ